MSVTSTTQQIEFLGLLVHSTTLYLSLPGEKLHHIRLEVSQTLQKDQVAGSNNRETACNIPSSPPSSLVLSFPLRGSTEGTEQQQSRLHCIHQPVPSIQKRTTVVAGETRPMVEHYCRDAEQCAMAPGSGDPGTRYSRECIHVNCLELLAATLAMQSFLKDQTAVSVLLQLDNQTAIAYINNLGG